MDRVGKSPSLGACLGSQRTYMEDIMYLNTSYQILKRDNATFLVNIDDGDVFEINDVTESIVSHCHLAKNAKDLAHFVYDIYRDTPGDFSETDLFHFIEEMLCSQIIFAE